jgi:hypothetical protein
MSTTLVRVTGQRAACRSFTSNRQAVFFMGENIVNARMLKHELSLRSQELSDQIATVLYGHNAEVQGATLADLLSMWLAGHHVLGDRERTDKLRDDLLEGHMQHVKILVQINEQIARDEGRFPPCPL